MATKTLWIVVILSLLAGLCAISETQSAEAPKLALTSGGKAECKLVVLTNREADSLLKRSAALIADTIKGWSGVELPLTMLSETARDLPADQAIVFTTLDALKRIAPDIESSHKEFGQATAIDEQGFIIVPLMNKNAKQLFLVSRTPRGVYNAAVYLRDFYLDGDRQHLHAEFQSLVRSPAMRGRPAYTLSIWGNEEEYTAADWGTIFQAFARDGVDHVYFWTSGHFPSKKFPQTYKCADGPLETSPKARYDTTVNSRIGTIADLQAIIRHAHDLGLKFYLGGGMGGWCGTGLITNKKPGTMKTGPGDASGSLCPSNPESRAALTDYYVEMFDALPEADGVFIELAEEWGECRCAQCARPIDKFGSKQFGQSLITLAREIAEKIRDKHPHAKFAFTVGYDEHAHDPAFYQAVREMGDENYEWLEARGRWEFAGPEGKPRPASFFSKKVIRWKQHYNRSLELMITDANRIEKEGMYGMAWCFEPGYATGSFYKDIPFPTDILPYVLSGFVYREASWNPALTVEEMRERIQRRFFGKEAPEILGRDLWELREIIRTRKGLNKLPAIEQHMEQARANASPKTQEGLKIMGRAVKDIQQYLVDKPSR
jgi:hypothetical protein